MITDAQEAVVSGNLKKLASEIAGTSDVNQPDRDGRTLLMWAVLEGRDEAVELLIGEGALIDTREQSGYTALHFAAQDQRSTIVRTLLDAGAEIDAKDEYGNTPLGRAVFSSRGKGETIGLLLKYGADPNCKNNHGVSPLGLANQISNYDVAQFSS